MGKSVGFIGLGTMGLPMARNLLGAGHAVRGYDVDIARVRELEEAGAEACDSARHAAEGADVVISMLPASRHVLAAMLGPAGAVEGLRPGATVIEMSTIDPGTTRRVAEAVAGRGCRMIDAPVSGGSAGARDATLTIMVGGEADVLEAHRDLLRVLGTRIVH